MERAMPYAVRLERQGTCRGFTMRIGGRPAQPQGKGNSGGGHDALTLARRAGIPAGHTIDEPDGPHVNQPAADRETGPLPSQQSGKTEADPRHPMPESPPA